MNNVSFLELSSAGWPLKGLAKQRLGKVCGKLVLVVGMVGRVCGKPSPRFPNWRHVRNGRKTEGERKEIGSARHDLELGAIWSICRAAAAHPNYIS